MGLTDEQMEQVLSRYLLSLDEIRGNAIRYEYVGVGIPGGSGVYFLLYDGDIVYTGKAASIFNRLRDHWAGDKLWTHCWYVSDVPDTILEEVEAMYLAWLKPILNVRHGRRYTEAAGRLIADLEPYRPFVAIRRVSR